MNLCNGDTDLTHCNETYQTVSVVLYYYYTKHFFTEVLGSFHINFEFDILKCSRVG